MKSYDHLNISIASVVLFRASRYVMRLNRTSVWKVMTTWISRELSFFNFERLNMWCVWIRHPSVKLWPFEFLHSFRCSISSVSIYVAPESPPRVKSYDHLNISKASVVLFRALRYVMRDENLEIGQIQAKGLTGKGRRPKWRRINPPSGEGWRPRGRDTIKTINCCWRPRLIWRPKLNMFFS